MIRQFCQIESKEPTWLNSRQIAVLALIADAYQANGARLPAGVPRRYRELVGNDLQVAMLAIYRWLPLCHRRSVDMIG